MRPLPMPSTTLSKRTFQLLALGTLPLPFLATWTAWPHLPRPGDDVGIAFAAHLLVGALTLLVCVALWAAALLPLRRRTALPPITQGLAGVSPGTLGAAYEGPPGTVHGGISALVLDHLLGEAASGGLTKPRFTGTITVRYLRGTPLGPLHAEAHIDRTEGHKTYARGFISDADGRSVEAEGVFITPAWARDGERRTP